MYIDEFVSQCLDRDWDALVERLTDDVVFLPPDEPMVIGKAAAADFLDTYPIMTRFSASIDSGDGRANHAALHGPFDMTVETEEGEIRMVGKWLATLSQGGGPLAHGHGLLEPRRPHAGAGFLVLMVCLSRAEPITGQGVAGGGLVALSKPYTGGLVEE